MVSPKRVQEQIVPKDLTPGPGAYETNKSQFGKQFPGAGSKIKLQMSPSIGYSNMST